MTTTGNLNINSGLQNARKQIDANASNIQIKLHSGLETEENYNPYYFQTIDNEKGIQINTTQPYIYQTSNKNYKIQTLNNMINITDNQILIGRNENDNGNDKNLITLGQNDGT